MTIQELFDMFVGLLVVFGIPFATIGFFTKNKKLGWAGTIVFLLGCCWLFTR